MAPTTTTYGSGGKPAPTQPTSTWASWLGWKSAPAAAGGGASGAEAGGALGTEEWRKLEELLASQVCVCVCVCVRGPLSYCFPYQNTNKVNNILGAL